ncbi:6-pyruvoyl trahydropterin synthase family protein [Aureicoccus marinus]|jgi:6-pyruvoyltetrahydropterin/6-carboxytetrahydropterin synthase|uniref:6-carboxy-5,6,7,8-tetrahydropterin synthase n=1 Tax=Aureicoccus marinus TaxID=754435 RepID=A0A2S7T7T2_9FLAO|nr:6-carboxytetrahydropterin synthase [Aureicoccus marinus]PQJ15993.1 6-pyruvoyl tetrahydrobiopterin synthase [Aureicoccus marinus]
MTKKNKTAIIRKEHFNAAHRLHNEHWSDEKNKQVFGKCNNPHFHGHNYDLEVRVVGFCDQDTGYVMDAKLLSDLIKEKVLNDFDHKNLNLEVDDFKTLNPTAENIARVIYERIRPHLDEELELKITLYETQRNVVEYPAR